MTKTEKERLLDILDELDGTGYGVTIRRKCEERFGRFVSYGEVYVALDELEEAGLARSAMREVTPDRGNRAKKHFWRT